MSKFEPLTKHLCRIPASEYRTTFSEVERILGFKLPPSARRHRPWWSNNASNSAMTKAWLAAGFRTEQVDMAGEKLVFRRTASAHHSRPASDNKPRRSPIGGLRGTVQVAPGVDLTEPTGEIWDAAEGRL
jgi:hypothetical protein